MHSAIRTHRLELIPATLEILESDLRNRLLLSRHLCAAIPAAWPPPLIDENVIREFIRMSLNTQNPLFAAWYWILDEKAAGARVLIGNGGIVGKEGEPDTAILGYSVLGDYQNRGYATEAVGALVPAIFSLPGISRIIATTYPHLVPSIRVLEKNGFSRTDHLPTGTGAEEGTVCYLLEKP